MSNSYDYTFEDFQSLTFVPIDAHSLLNYNSQNNPNIPHSTSQGLTSSPATTTTQATTNVSIQGNASAGQLEIFGIANANEETERARRQMEVLKVDDDRTEFPCSLCSKVFPRLIALKSHFVVHGTVK